LNTGSVVGTAVEPAVDVGWVVVQVLNVSVMVVVHYMEVVADTEGVEMALVEMVAYFALLEGVTFVQV